MPDLFNLKSDGKRKKIKFNPRPEIPKTGWKRRSDFPDLSRAKAICIDVETKDPGLIQFGAGWGRGVGHIIGVAVGTDDGWQRYYPIRHECNGEDNHDPEVVFNWLRKQLSRSRQTKVGHNLIYDLGWLREENVVVKGKLWDTRIAEKLLNYYEDASLGGSCSRYGIRGKDESILYDWCWKAFGQSSKPSSKKSLRANAMQNLYRTPATLVGFYAESDVRAPIELAKKQYKKLNKAGLDASFDLECKLLPLLIEMRMAGVSVDIDAAEKASKGFEKNINNAQKKIDKITGRKGTQTGSPKEMGPIFDSLGIETQRTPTGQVSLKASVLEQSDHNLCKLIIDIEELKKYKSTFIDGYILESSINGKLFGEFDPLGAKTGRFSSRNPNLQNLPSRNNLAHMIRSCFVPDEGHPFWRKYDYASIENRIFAHYAVGSSGDRLRQQYIDNPQTDYHNWCLDLVAPIAGWDISTEEKYKKWRKPIKNINFGIVYGLQAKSLAAQLGIPFKKAKVLLQSYNDALPYVSDTMDYFSRRAGRKGYSETLLGRKVVFDKWEPCKYDADSIPLPRLIAIKKYGLNIMRAGLYKATNYTIQGTAADQMKSAMVKCWEDGIFDATGVPRMTVHDELDFSDPGGSDEAFREMSHVMETAVDLRVPVLVDGEIGPNWADLTDIPR